jgi:hypothetical protein
LSVRRPGKFLIFPDEEVDGDEAIEAGLFDAGVDGLGAGGEVDIDGDFPGEDDGEVGDHAGAARGEEDADAFGVGFEADNFCEDDGGGEEAVEAVLAFIEAIDEFGSRSVFFEALEEGEAEVFGKGGADFEGEVGGEEEVFLIVGEIDGFAFEEFSEGEDEGIEIAAGFDIEAGILGMIDEEGEEWGAGAGDELEGIGGDGGEGAGAGEAFAGDEDDEGVLGDVAVEGFLEGIDVFIADGEEEGGGGFFFEVSLKEGVDDGVFFEEVDEGAVGEDFFEMEQVLEGELVGNDDGAGGGEVFLTEDIGFMGGHVF